MRIRVQKYGGTSLVDAQRVDQVARQIASGHRDGAAMVVVVSAMGGTTDQLLALAGDVHPEPAGRELDALLSTGEKLSAALVALAVEALGVPARSLSGPEAGIVTDGPHGEAGIVGVDPARIRAELEHGVVVVTGFQGRCRQSGEVTTLGRGGSDATATALAAALRAEVCEIVTDVDGIFTADPRRVPSARRRDRISYEQMLRLARAGAQVLMPRCVEDAIAHQVLLHVRAVETRPGGGSWIGPQLPRDQDAGWAWRHRVVDGLACRTGQAAVTLRGFADGPVALSSVLASLTAAGIGAELTTRVGPDDRVDVLFVLPGQDADRAEATLEGLRDRHTFDGVDRREPLGRLSLVGSGLESRPTVACTLLRAVSEAGVTVLDGVFTDHRIAILSPESQLEPALVAAHDALAGEGWLHDEVPAIGRTPVLHLNGVGDG